MNDAISITRDLVRCPSVTPADAGALGVLENLLKAAGFEVHRVTFSEPGTADVDNLYARGAVDMKGGIACSVAAVLQYLQDHDGKPQAGGNGSISFLITGDEEDV